MRQQYLGGAPVTIAAFQKTRDCFRLASKGYSKAQPLRMPNHLNADAAGQKPVNAD